MTKQDVEMVKHLLASSPREIAIGNVSSYLRGKELNEQDFVVVLTLVDCFLTHEVVKSRLRFRLSAFALAIAVVSFVISLLTLCIHG